MSERLLGLENSIENTALFLDSLENIFHSLDHK